MGRRPANRCRNLESGTGRCLVRQISTGAVAYGASSHFHVIRTSGGRVERLAPLQGSAPDSSYDPANVGIDLSGSAQGGTGTNLRWQADLHAGARGFVRRRGQTERPAARAYLSSALHK